MFRYQWFRVLGPFRRGLATASAAADPRFSRVESLLKAGLVESAASEVRPLLQGDRVGYQEWTRLANGLNMAGHHGWSIGILNQMVRQGFQLDGKLFNVAMDAVLELARKNMNNRNHKEGIKCARSGIELFKSMHRVYGATPTVYHLELAAQLFEILGDFRGLRRLVAEYPRQCHLNDTVAACLASLNVGMQVLPQNLKHLGEFRQYVRRNIPGDRTFRHLIAKGLSEKIIGLGHVSAVLTQLEENFDDSDPRRWLYRGGKRIQRTEHLAVAITAGLVDAGYLRAAHGIHNSLLADIQSPQSFRVLFRGAAEAATVDSSLDVDDSLSMAEAGDAQHPLSKRGLERLVMGLQEDMAQNGFVLRGPEVSYTIQVLEHAGGPHWTTRALSTIDRASLFGTPIPRIALFRVLEGTLQAGQVDRAEQLMRQFVLRGVFNPTQLLRLHDIFIRECVGLGEVARANKAIHRIENTLAGSFDRARHKVAEWKTLLEDDGVEEISNL